VVTLIANCLESSPKVLKQHTKEKMSVVDLIVPLIGLLLALAKFFESSSLSNQVLNLNHAFFFTVPTFNRIAKNTEIYNCS
jgi:hypothetical protein